MGTAYFQESRNFAGFQYKNFEVQSFTVNAYMGAECPDTAYETNTPVLDDYNIAWDGRKSIENVTVIETCPESYMTGRPLPAHAKRISIMAGFSATFFWHGNPSGGSHQTTITGTKELIGTRINPCPEEIFKFRPPGPPPPSWPPKC